jgi:ketosteroid isomerase-like protein
VRLTLPLSLVSLTACSGGLPGVAHLDLQKARTQIDSLNARFVTWLAADQLDSAAALYAADGVLMAPNALAVVGRPNIRTAWAGLTASHRLQFVLQTTDLIGGDSVLVEHGRYALHAAPKTPADSTAAASDDHGSYVVVWIHRGGRWQVRFDIATSDRPPPQAAVPGT